MTITSSIFNILKDRFLSIDTIPFILYGGINRYIQSGGYLSLYVPNIINFGLYGIIGYNLYQIATGCKILGIELRNILVNVPISDPDITISDKQNAATFLSVSTFIFALSFDVFNYYIAKHLGSALYNLYNTLI